MIDRWYEVKGEPHDTLLSTFSAIKSSQSDRVQSDLDNLRLYGSLDYTGFAPGTFLRSPANQRQQRVSWNICAACTDTLTSKLAQHKNRPMFLPNSGDYSLQKKTKDLTKFVHGQIQSLDLYAIGRQVFRDACVFGTGFLKVFADGPQIRAERVFPTEIYVDLVEGMHGKPQQIFQVKSVLRDVLMADFPKHSQAIKNAARIESDEVLPTSSAREDYVEVVEAWKLPAGKNKGRNAIAISGATLSDREWTRKTFPILAFRYLTRPVGYYGQGCVEQLVGVQIEINKLLHKIQRSMELMAVPTIFIDRASEVVSSHLTNEIGKIVRFTGKPPQYHIAPTVHPEIFKHLDTLWNRGFEIVGLSQLTAASQKPSGLDSGVALRTFIDHETERYMEVAQCWEEYFLRIAEELVELGREIHEAEGDFSVKVKGKGFFEQISWNDVDLEEDQYVIDLYPTSLLPQRPEGRLQKTQELIQSGFIGPEDAMDLLDLPDLERYTDLEKAGRDVIKRGVDEILQGGEYAPPEPFDPLEYALRYSKSVYHKARLDGAPEESLELVRQYIADVLGLLEQANPPPPPPAPPPQAAPMAPAIDQQQQLEAGMLPAGPEVM